MMEPPFVFIAFVGVAVFNAWLAKMVVKRSVEGEEKWLRRVRLLGAVCLSLAIVCGMLGVVLAMIRSEGIQTLGFFLAVIGLPLVVSGVVCRGALKSWSFAKISWRGVTMEASEISSWVAALAVFRTWVLATLGLVLWALGFSGPSLLGITSSIENDMFVLLMVVSFLVPSLFLGILGSIIVQVLFRRRRQRILSSQDRE